MTLNCRKQKRAKIPTERLLNSNWATFQFQLSYTLMLCVISSCFQWKSNPSWAIHYTECNFLIRLSDK